jgi:hypothetical protein
LRSLRVLAVLVVAGAFVDAGNPVDAQEEPVAAALGGFTGRAAASGLSAKYNPEGLLPVPTPVDISAPDALATIASGPSTFARASVLDPGELLANPDALLQQASSSYPTGLIPAYPLRISASSAGEPSSTLNAAPGLTARVDAAESTSRAAAQLPGLDAPAIAHVGSLTAEATTETDGSSVTVHARTVVGGIDVLGLLRIESVITDVRAHSDGGEPVVEGGTTVVGADILGFPVTVSDEGVALDGNGSGAGSLLGVLLAPLGGSLNELLGQVGIHITVAGPVELVGTTDAQLAATGLRIDVELSDRTVPALIALIRALPPIDNPIPGAPGIEDVLQIAKVRHLSSIEFARASVALSARSAGSFDAPASGSAELPLPPGGSFDLGFPSTPQLTGTGRTPSGTAGPAAPRASTEAGIGALVLLALISQPLLGDRLAMVAGAVLAGPSSTSCTREGQ